MRLADLVSSVYGWESKTDEEIVAYLNGELEYTDDRTWTVQGIRNAIGDEGAGLVMYSLKNTTNPLIQSAYTTMAVVGLTLDSPDRQILIDVLATEFAWPAELATAVKRLGRPMSTPYIQAGFNGQVTTEEVAAARNILVQEAAEIALRDRIINATALANERLPSAEDKAATWAQCWEDAV